MNKKKAKESSDNFKGTFGDLMTIVSKSKTSDASASRINPILTHGKAREIFYASLAGARPTDAVIVWAHDPYSRKGGMKRARAWLITYNIFRECGE